MEVHEKRIGWVEIAEMDARTALAAAITTAIITVESSGCVNRNAIDVIYISRSLLQYYSCNFPPPQKT